MWPALSRANTVSVWIPSVDVSSGVFEGFPFWSTHDRMIPDPPSLHVKTDRAVGASAGLPSANGYIGSGLPAGGFAGVSITIVGLVVSMSNAAVAPVGTPCAVYALAMWCPSAVTVRGP